jgi:WD40 repeat protein
LFGSQAGVFLASADGKPEHAFATDLDHVHHLAFSPDGSLLAVAGGRPAEFGAVELWSWRDRTRVRELDGHDDVVYAAEWLDDARTLITAAADRTIRVWDVTTGNLVATLTGHSGPVLCLAASPDGKLICSGSVDQTIRVWDRATWQPLRSLTNHLGPVHALVFSNPASTVGNRRLSFLASAGGDGTVRIWQPEIGRLVRIVRHPYPVLSIAWHSPRFLYSGSKDGQLRLLDADAGEIVREEYLNAGWIMCVAVQRSTSQVWAGDSRGRIQVVSSER